MIVHQLQSEINALANQARSYNILKEQVEKLEKEITYVEQEKVSVEMQSQRTLKQADEGTQGVVKDIETIKELLS
jgi:uncharacterized protein YdcH (DUF465 family)